MLLRANRLPKPSRSGGPVITGPSFSSHDKTRRSLATAHETGLCRCRSRVWIVRSTPATSPPRADCRSTTTTGHVDEVEIEIPGWVYDNIVKEKGHPHILTINPDYFLITQGIGRVIYRLARKAAGKGQARYSLNEQRPCVA
jgi:Replication initiator protein A